MQIGDIVSWRWYSQLHSDDDPYAQLNEDDLFEISHLENDMAIVTSVRIPSIYGECQCRELKVLTPVEIVKWKKQWR